MKKQDIDPVIIGKATIHNADCMDIMSNMPDNHFDLAIVDPPYFSGPNKLHYYRNQRFSKTGVVNKMYKTIDTWDVPDSKYFDELLRVSKHQIVWGVNNYDVVLGAGRIVWDKVNNTSTFSDCEIAYCSLFDSIRLFKFMWNGMLQGVSANDGTTIQGDKKKNEKRIHPTQKPVALYEWLLTKYANEGDKILDTHLGSGSIAIATNKLGYELTGCEKDTDYFNASVERIDREDSQGVLFETTQQQRSFIL